jgi:hypothetical protein
MLSKSAQPVAATCRKCAPGNRNCQSQIASIDPEDKLPFGSVKLAKRLAAQ